MLSRAEGVSWGGDAQLSAQKIPLLYPGQDAALYHICHVLGDSQPGPWDLVALPDPTGNGMMWGPLGRELHCQGVQSPSSIARDSGSLRELLKEQDVWLGKLFYFITVLSIEKT